MKNLFWGPVTGWWLGWWLHYATLKALPRPQVLILVRGEQSIWFFLTRLRMRTFHGCDLPSMEKNRKPGSPFEIDCCCPKTLVCILETFRLLNKLFNLQVLFHFTWTSQPTQFDSLRIIKCQLTTRSFSFGDIAIYQNHLKSLFKLSLPFWQGGAYWNVRYMFQSVFLGALKIWAYTFYHLVI